MQRFYSNLKADTMPGAEIGTAQRQQFVERLRAIAEDCCVLRLPKTLAVVECLISEYTAVEHTHL